MGSQEKPWGLQRSVQLCPVAEYPALDARYAVLVHT